MLIPPTYLTKDVFGKYKDYFCYSNFVIIISLILYLKLGDGADMYLSSSKMLGKTTEYCFKHATTLSHIDGPKFPRPESPPPGMKDPEKKQIIYGD